MNNAAVKLLRDLARKQEQENFVPAFDDILQFALERRYLGIGEFRDILLEQMELLQKESLSDRLRSRVRLIQVEEICFDRRETFHLPGVESVLSSMRDCGHSLVFLVSGEPYRTRVFVGLSQFDDDPIVSLDSAIDGYRAAWLGHFPGTRFSYVSNDEAEELSYLIGRSAYCGVLTGIPSLKREEDSTVFVQGIERLIRTMRGRSYTWLSIADPIGLTQIDQALDACRALTSDIHRLVRVDLNKAVSSGKTVMMGMFGMIGKGETEGQSESETWGTSESESKTYAGPSTLTTMGAAIGGTIGSILPGVGTLIGGAIGAIGGFALGLAKDGLSNFLMLSKSNSITNTHSFTKTVSHAVASQMAGGGFGSFGLSWTKTTAVNQELLNRKAEFCEELLRQHEDRLQQGSALGMWNVGHYFFAEDMESFSLGQAVVRSLFAGMDSYYEPPRVIRLPKDCTTLLRRFANLYISFPNNNLRSLFVTPPPEGSIIVASHPLGYWFNGVGTPVNTKELAIAMPLARQDVEGVSVTERARFGVNLAIDASGPSITIGTVEDCGEQTMQKYHLHLSSLPKHVGIFGLTGSGKTNTVCNILTQLWKKYRVPFMIIEPAKSEYRRLASSPELKDDLVVITAGVEHSSACPLRLNPFEFDPGRGPDSGGVHVLTHIDRLKATFNASFPMYASMPYILEEAILEVYRERGWDIGYSCNRFVDIYRDEFHDYLPTLRDLYHKIDSIVRRKGYWVEQQMNIEAALKARLSSLMVGAKGQMLNCSRSLPSKSLFNAPVVVELKHLGDDDEKAFLMGLLVTKLYEYREATIGQDDDAKPLKHILVIEEAHRLLKNTAEGTENLEVANVKGKAVTAFVDMLAEIRAYGQGVIVVDQVPSRVNANVIKGTATKNIHRLLSEDDREMVGKCMGLSDEQIEDLVLLETGRCVIHEDGQRRAFQCRVELNVSHENTASSTLGEGTLRFKDDHIQLLDPLSEWTKLSDNTSIENVDTDDYLFYKALHKAMLASIFSSADEAVHAFARVMPTRYAIKGLAWPFQARLPWLWVYWKQISDEIWAYYRGEYRDFLAYVKAGWKYLVAWASEQDVEESLVEYRAAALNYSGVPRSIMGVALQNPVANVYEQLLTRSEIINNIRNRFRLESRNIKQEPPIDKLARCVLYQINELIPAPPFVASMQLVDGLLEGIFWRVQWPAGVCAVIRNSVLSLRTRRNEDA